MKKIVFCNIPMKDELFHQNYAGTGNVKCKYDKSVIYAISPILAETLKKDDDVKLVMLVTKGEGGENDAQSLINAKKFEDEVTEINKNIGAKLSFTILESAFKETKENYELQMKDMIHELEDNCEIYADITFGPKPLPMVLMCVLNFADKFMNADIKTIAYGKLEFIKKEMPDGTVQKTAYNALYDISSLYYLYSMTNSMEAENSTEALAALDLFFKL